MGQLLCAYILFIHTDLCTEHQTEKWSASESLWADIRSDVTCNIDMLGEIFRVF